MATGSPVSIHEYLSTSYRPDCDNVDGAVVERNVGEYDHGRLQGVVSCYYFISQPDVCVIADLGKPEQIFKTPPLACIEILSKDDRLSEMQDRVDDYLKFGVRYVWILDPSRRKARRCTADGMREVAELRTEEPETIVPVAALFE